MAVILSGGTGSRMGGVDKAALTYAGASMLERALRAVAAADPVVVVGPAHPLAHPAGGELRFVREEPPLGGPAAALLAGRDSLGRVDGLMVVLAVDMPLVGPATVDRLVAAATGVDGAFLTDAEGRRQLAGVLRLAALDGVRPARGTEPGLPLHRLLHDLELAAVPPVPDEGRDVDTWDDYAGLPG